jgi:hypothetical protein
MYCPPGDPSLTSTNLHHPFGLCSCVALMDLVKMRAAGWAGSFMAAALAAHVRDVNPAEAFPYGDQDVLRIVQRHYPGDQPRPHPAAVILLSYP